MATETTVPMDDKELFSAAMADEPAEVVETPVEQPQETVTEQPRDEHGRFAPKTDTAPEADAAPTQQQPETVTEPKDEDGNVPSWRLREIREERDAARRQAQEIERQAMAERQQNAALQRRLAELQAPKQEPVDFFADPDKAFGQRLSPIEERFAKLEAETRMSNSRALAIAEHGIAAVREAEKAVDDAVAANDPSLQTLSALLVGNRDPVGAAIQWHSNNKLMKETGGNLTSYREKVLEGAMKDPAFVAKVIEANKANAGRPNIQLPPSLNKTAGSGITASELASEDMSDRALFRHAVGGR